MSLHIQDPHGIHHPQSCVDRKYRTTHSQYCSVTQNSHFGKQGWKHPFSPQKIIAAQKQDATCAKPYLFLLLVSSLVNVSGSLCGTA